MPNQQDAYKKFLANNPEGEREYRTLSISHSLMSKTYNLVMDTVDLYAFDENGGLVHYSPAGIKESSAIQSNDLDQAASYTISDTLNVLDSEMDRIPLNDSEPVVVTFRAYLSDYLDSPVDVIAYNVDSVAQTKGYFTLKTGVPNLNSDQTGQIYSLSDFPMMRSL